MTFAVLVLAAMGALSQDLSSSREATADSTLAAAKTDSLGISASDSLKTFYADSVLRVAYSHLGDKYKRGNSGPNYFDCSGFTHFVYKVFGIDLSRSSKAQFRQGNPVERNDLKSGDLVFFSSPRSGKNVGHVGIVVDVDHKKDTFSFIHASYSGVRVSSSLEPFYVHRYIGARRIM